MKHQLASTPGLVPTRYMTSPQSCAYSGSRVRYIRVGRGMRSRWQPSGFLKRRDVGLAGTNTMREDQAACFSLELCASTPKRAHKGRASSGNEAVEFHSGNPIDPVDKELSFCPQEG
ncbi:hypothetical protein PoB_003068400 [Plakobranchus ocellatus]|uniref:Uncharacterized protein n=1 Tax=Plakobranchus ocellatus TaxID=259542 RepID=A0AAV4ACN2_9GAST|nr:hypothetical protein PoB_003068400 [Plakobranchus ocellatus]